MDPEIKEILDSLSQKIAENDRIYKAAIAESDAKMAESKAELSRAMKNMYREIGGFLPIPWNQDRSKMGISDSMVSGV